MSLYLNYYAFIQVYSTTQGKVFLHTFTHMDPITTQADEDSWIIIKPRQ
jgi:hypothetical protein